MLKKHLILAYILIVSSVFIFYSNSFTVSFQFDDTHTVQSNIFVRSLKYIPLYFVDAKTFSYRPENSGYRPMTTTALAIGFAISKLDTWGYHLIKLIEHGLMGILIFLIGLTFVPRTNRLWGDTWHGRYFVALFGALIFVSHRAHTETVNYISAISTLQAGLFFMVAFYLYYRFRETDKKSYFALSVFCYLLSMFSKEEGVTLPAMVFFYEFIYRRPAESSYWEHVEENWKKWVKFVAPYVATAVLFIVLRTVFQPAEADVSRGNTPVFVYFITQFRSWLYYWQLFFWPVTLNADNLAFEFSQTFWDPRVLGSLAVHILIWVIAFKNRYKKPFITFSIIWMYITVLPASSVFPLVEAVTEHRMYIPYVFLSLLAVYKFFELMGLLLEKKPEVFKTRMAVVVISFFVFLLGVGTYARTQVWQTPITLWKDVLDKNPNSPRAMNVLAVGYINEQNFEKALPILETCQRIAAPYLPCKVHLSLVYAHFKDYQKGLEVLKNGLSYDPEYVHLNFHIATYYKEYFGDFEKARHHFQIVETRTSGRLFHATLKLGEMDMEEGNVVSGMKRVEEVLKIDNGNAEAWELYAKGHMLMNQFPQAKELFIKLKDIMPGNPKPLLGLANIEERMNNLDEAKKYYEQALSYNMATVQAWQGLARIAEKKQDKLALTQFQTKVKELIESKQYIFWSSSFMIGEKPRQIAPVL